MKEYKLDYELSHPNPTLGQGALQGFFQTECGIEIGTSILLLLA